MNKLQKVAILASTHWDREWYRDFQTFRFHLVKVLNDVLAVLEKDEALTLFILDGQTAMLEDYLEVMPQNETRVKKLLDAGRLKAGPFYTLPDENLVSGESLIANLKMGYASVKKLTSMPVWGVGYLCDMFGHVAQMPQILQGFGIQNALLGRGTNQCETPPFFTWKSPDGSAVTTFREPEQGGYGNFWYEVFSEDHQGTDACDDTTKQNAERAFAIEQERVNSTYSILMDGVDHEPLHHSLPALAQHLQKTFDCQVTIGNVEEIYADVRQSAQKLPVRIGELQRPAKEKTVFHALIFATLSSRVDIKRQNDTVMHLLEKNAGAASALALMYDIAMPDAVLQTAHKYVLQNHAHDSICGCSLGEVHLTMQDRFRQAATIAREYAGHVFSAFCPQQSFEKYNEKEHTLCVKVMNPLPYEVHGVQTVSILFPQKFSCTQTEQMPDEAINSFRLFSGDKEVPYQLLQMTKDAVAHRSGYIFPERGHRYTVLANLDLPPMGIATLTIKPDCRPVRFAGSLRTAPLCAENALVRLAVEPNGTVVLTDKVRGKHFSDVLRFSHVGETGDAWYHRPPVGGTETWATFQKASIVYDGPVACGICLVHCLTVPKQLLYLRRATVEDEVQAQVFITTTLRVAADADFVQIDIEIENTALDGKICLQLPCESAPYFAETPFAFVQRAPGYDTTTINWFETDKAEKSFTGVLYQKEGLAFVSGGGLHEGGINLHTNRMEITLLRSFRKLFMTEDEPYGQLLGKQCFSALLLPAGSHTNGDFIRLKETLQTEFLQDTLSQKESGAAAQSLGFWVESNAVAVSTIARSGEQVLVRMVHYGEEKETILLHSTQSICGAVRVNLLEEVQEILAHEANTLQLTLKPFAIVTVLVQTNA